MNNLLAVASLIASALSAPVIQDLERSVSSPCPVEVPRMRRNLMHFLNAQDHEAAREAVGFGRTEVRTLRVLSGSEDAGICTRLSALLEGGAYSAPPYRRAYYATENFYFVTFTQEFVPGMVFHMGHTPTVVVLDRELKPLYATSRGAGGQPD